jgi:hypothetical protein
MAIILRCDECMKETTIFTTIVIERRRCVGKNPPFTERSLSFDVCSATCEVKVITKVLTKLLPPEVTLEEKTNEQR